MKIIGFTINKIQAERKNPVKDKLEIKSGLNIEDITKETVDISKNSAIKFDFTYSVDYTPDVAEIKIKGSVIAIDEKGESKDLLKE